MAMAYTPAMPMAMATMVSASGCPLPAMANAATRVTTMTMAVAIKARELMMRQAKTGPSFFFLNIISSHTSTMFVYKIVLQCSPQQQAVSDEAKDVANDASDVQLDAGKDKGEAS